MLITKQLTKSKSLIANIAIAFSGSILLALLARLSIPVPFSPVPITGQTFGVLFLGATLGSRLGALSILMYLIEGVSGLPVFAGGQVGFLYMFGPTGGYLIGFIAAAYFVGYLTERDWTSKLSTCLLTMIIGTAIIFLFGIFRLSITAGIGQALTIGLLPYLAGAVIKIVLATGVVYSLSRINQ